ncbi:hypothetical protein [Dyella japonica]|uniref:DUF4136 domain-containing protein n=1 Tax=Dyella japonica TaxID=231455 RepID=A0ABV2JY02_9GAMM
MRVRMMAVTALGLLLSACASVPGAGQAPVQLFGAQDAPRFHAYLACTSHTVDCTIVQRAFDRWADERHVALDAVAPDNAAFMTGKPSPATEQSQPYRVTMRYAPDLSAPANPMGGGSMRPMISYTATVHVFDATTGRLLKTMSFKDKAIIDQDGGPANPYIDAQVHAFLKQLDPAYARASAS